MSLRALAAKQSPVKQDDLIDQLSLSRGDCFVGISTLRVSTFLAMTYYLNVSPSLL
jgi:hypothetical protein